MSAGGAQPGPEVEDVFGTYEFNGNGGTNNITNGLDYSTEGGMYWQHSRNGYRYALFCDTERGTGKHYLPMESRHDNYTTGLTAFNTNGVTLGASADMNTNNEKQCSWGFRNCPKFFEVISYTGNGTAGRTISHNLGCEVGAMYVFKKSVNSIGMFWHRKFDDVSGYDYSTNGYLRMNSLGAVNTSSTLWNNTVPTNTTITLGTNTDVNANGVDYIMYLWAHNNGDGQFGINGDKDIIKCGSYTGNGNATTGVEVDLGFEPQFILIKDMYNNNHWTQFDMMRLRSNQIVGTFANTGYDDRLRINEQGFESESGYIDFNPTGFKITTNLSDVNQNGSSYMYIAVRRPTKQYDAVDDLFECHGSGTGTNPGWSSSFPVDLAIIKSRGGNQTYSTSRLVSPYNTYLSLNSASDTGLGSSQTPNDDYMNGFYSSGISNWAAWMWRRCPGFFDEVCWQGNGTAGRTITHNLEATPEMMWVKARSRYENWAVYHSAMGTQNAAMNENYAFSNVTNIWNGTAPTDTQITVGTSDRTNKNGESYVGYLFASLEGISKIGSYTGQGSSNPISIDCGFSTSAQFVLVKGASQTGSWYIIDTARGLTSSTDSYLEWNNSEYERTSFDMVDPYSTGFTVIDSSLLDSGVTYIYYAISG